MKLYTEEELRKHLYNHDERFFEKLTPIELPSDEEIVKQSKYIAHNYFEMYHANHYQGLEEGALRMASWMRDKIQGGNK